MVLDVDYYQTSGGARPFVRWLDKLVDRQARTRILARIARLAVGNPGDMRAVGGGVIELKVDWGPGYRIYLACLANRIVLLCAGDKRTQQRDIKRAKA